MFLTAAVLYGVIFFRVVVEKSTTRLDVLAHYVILFDELVSSWFGKPPQFSILDRIPIIVTAVGLLGVSAMVGHLALKALKVTRILDRTETFVFSLGLGLNFVSLATLFAGLMGRLDRNFVFAPLAILTVVAWFAMHWRAKRKLALSPPPESNSASAREQGMLWRLLAIGAIVPFVVLIVFGGLTPTFDFDVLAYHLQAPKEFFQAGRIEFTPHNVYANMPLGAEMSALLGMVVLDDWWRGALVGKLVIALFAPLTALGLFCAGRRFVGSVAGVVAAIVWISIPWVTQLSNVGMIEGPYACYLWLAVFAFAIAIRDSSREKPSLKEPTRGANADGGALSNSSQRDSNRGESKARRLDVRFTALAGLLAGAGVACKYPALLMVVVPLGLGVCVFAWRTRSSVAGSGRSFKIVATYGLAVSLACGPWFGKNWALTGNPTYPLLYGVFGGKTRTREKDAQWTRAHQASSFTASDLILSLEQVGLSSQLHSPLIVPLVAFAFVAPRSRKLALGMSAMFVFAIAAWWLFTHRIDRFWIPALPIAAFLAGIGGATLVDFGWRRPLAVVLALGLFYDFVRAGNSGNTNLFVSLERVRTTPTVFNQWHLELSRLEPLSSRVLFVGDAGVFDVERPLVYNTVFDDSIFVEIIEGREPGEIRREFERRNISHVFVDWTWVGRYREPGNYGFPEIVTEKLFRRLVRDGVLAEPLPKLEGYKAELYPVRGG